MCGIASIFSKESVNLKNAIDNMVHAANHRGPDAFGHHIEDDYAFGHTRLSIIDLNKRSNQPFYDKSGRYIIVFNGEIYNFNNIKSKIGNKYKFLTSSDTEVLLAAYIIFGKSMLDMLNGCFSFSIYDQEQKVLFFARDRLGIKPLYYYYDKQYFIISSELRQILFSGLIKKEIDNNAINQIVQYQSSKAPSTIIKNIKMLNPGNFGQFYKENFKTFPSEAQIRYLKRGVSQPGGKNLLLELRPGGHELFVGCIELLLFLPCSGRVRIVGMILKSRLGKTGDQPVVVTDGDRVILVVVTPCTCHG